MVLEYSENQYDLLYSIHALTSSGTLKSIPQLKELVMHAKQYVSGSTLFALIKLAKSKEMFSKLYFYL